MLNFFRKNKENTNECTEERVPRIEDNYKMNTIVCDCCGVDSVIVKETTMTADNEPIAILKPIIDYENGIIEEGVCICQKCLDSCKSPKDGQLKWIQGKINSFKKLIEEKEHEKKENNTQIDNLKKLNNNIDINIYSIKNSINKLTIDYKRIENEIPKDIDMDEKKLEEFSGKKEESMIEFMNIDIDEK